MLKILEKKVVVSYINVFIGNILSRAISFITNVIIAKQVSIDDFGTFRWVLSLITYLLLTIDFGFSTFLLKEYHNNSISLEKAIKIQIYTRFPASIILFLFSSFFVIVLFNLPVEKILFYELILLNVVFFVFEINYIFNIKEKFEAYSVLLFLKSILFFIIILIFNELVTLNLIYLAIAFTVSSVIYYFLEWFEIFRKKLIDFKLFVSEKITINDTINILKKSIFINLSYIMITIYYNLDAIMLGILKDSYSVAIYSVAYSFLLLAILPTNILYTVYSPTLAKNVYSKEILKKYVKYTIALGFVIFLGLLILHKYLILLTYGYKYQESSQILLLLSFDIIPCYTAGAFANPINVWGHYKAYLYIVSSGAIVNFVGNLILIPIIGIYGAILTTILSEIVVTIFAIIFWVRNRGLLK